VKSKKTTTEARIAAVCGNGPFETKDVAEVQSLAQLGAKVLEILRSSSFWLERSQVSSASALASFECAARSLGLLEEKGGKQ
jgi:hypothetical protein